MLEGQPLDEISTATVLDYVTARREEKEGLASSTLMNDLTAWSQVMEHAFLKKMVAGNPLNSLPKRQKMLGNDAGALNPPTDAEVQVMMDEVRGWSEDMARLLNWLRETGMRLGEALNIRAGDIHPCGTRATLRHGVKGNRASGLKTREIALGRAALLLPELKTKGRLFGGLSDDSAVVSTRYGQWCRQRQGRENKAANADGREASTLRRFRLHDLRHAFAMASVVDQPNRLGELKDHMGHAHMATTEGYTRFLKGNGSQWRYARDPSLFGSLPAE